MGSGSALRRWRQKMRDRNAELAARMAELDRLSDGKSEAWSKIFSRPDWRAEPYTHQGSCRCCGAPVDFHSASCEACHARWFEPQDPRQGRRTLLFALSSLAVALLGGVGFKILIGALLRNIGHNPDFIEFVESYLWVAGTVLILVGATYVYEYLDIVPKGHWQAVKRLDKSKSLRHH